MITGSTQGQTANELLGVPLPQAAWSCIRRARYHNLLHFQAASITLRLSLFVHIRNRRLHLLRRVSVPPTFIFKRASVYADPPDSVLYRNSPHMKSPTTAKRVKEAHIYQTGTGVSTKQEQLWMKWLALFFL